MKKKIKIFSSMAALSFMTQVWASSNEVNYSPYVDMTINTHWDQKYQDMEPIDLIQISRESGIKQYHLAFITDAGSCHAAWGGQSAYSIDSAWAKHLTDKLQEEHKAFSIAFGGASGDDISKSCSDVQLTSWYEKVISTYHPSALDFDIENGSADVDKIMRALKQIQTLHPQIPISFTLPVLPEGLTGEGEGIVKKAQNAGLTFSVNIMAMDYGPSYTADMGQYAIQAATNVWQFLKTLSPTKSDEEIWKKIEVTPMIGVNDVNVEQFTLANVDTLVDFAKKKKIAGLAMWSVTRDTPCADKWASPICSGNNLQDKPYAYSRRFMQ